MPPPPLISKRLIAVNSASSLVVRVINITVLVWLYQYLLKRIPAEEYAIYPVVMSIIAFSPLLTTVLTGGVVRHVVHAFARENSREVTTITSSLLPFLLGGGLVLLLASGIFCLYIDSVLTINPDQVGEARLMFILLAAGTIHQVILVPFTAGLHAYQRYVWINGINVFRELLRIGLLFVLLFGIDTRVLWIVVATVTANFAANSTMGIISLRLLPSLAPQRKMFQLAKARELLSFGSWTTLGQFAYLLCTSADIIILNKLGTAIHVTAYHLGSIINNQIHSTISIVNGPLQPVLVSLDSTGDRQRLRNLFLRGGRYALWASLLIASPAILHRETIIQLYVGNTYIEAAGVILLLMATYPFCYPNVLLPQVCLATGRVRAFSSASLVVQIINVLLTVYLVKYKGMGAIGAAMGTFVTNIASQLLFFWPFSIRLLDLKWKTFWHELLRPGLTPAIAALLPCIILKQWMPPHTWTGVAAHAMVSSAIYAVTLLGTCLNKSESLDLRRLTDLVLNKFRYRIT